LVEVGRWIWESLLVTGEADAGGLAIISFFALHFSLEQDRCAAGAAR
jgi:hypothetical protein